MLHLFYFTPAGKGAVKSPAEVFSIMILGHDFQLHKEMLEHILTSTMAFFDTTPIGRIINRFSKDIDEVDLMIPTHIKG